MRKIDEIKKGVEKALTPFIVNRKLHAKLTEIGIDPTRYAQLRRLDNMNYDSAKFWIDKLNLQVDLSYMDRLLERVEKVGRTKIAKELGVTGVTVHNLIHGRIKPRLNLLDRIIISESSSS